MKTFRLFAIFVLVSVAVSLAYALAKNPPIPDEQFTDQISESAKQQSLNEQPAEWVNLWREVEQFKLPQTPAIQLK